jgi:hypothetical protein
VSSEGESYEVPMSIAKMSTIVATMITEDQDDPDAEVQEGMDFYSFNAEKINS